ncbi:MAG TPA: hypothetical protein VKF59_02960 [Candidatus Dormibacteraeota bacterium]|nr:hypothetical protein [Candidatus Dormibacteraeota bacterium]
MAVRFRLGVVLGAAAILAVAAAAWLGLLSPVFRGLAGDAVRPRVVQQAGRGLDNRAGPAAPPVSATPAAGSPLGNSIEGHLGPDNPSATVPDRSVLSITDLVIDNPGDDAGTLHLQRVAAGASAGIDLLMFELGTFRDLDYHFVTPVTLTAGQKLQIVCQPAAGTTTCGASVTYSGFLKRPPA